MRGQSGIGTIIVFIAMILAAVVVAVVILQITNDLRGQTLLAERQAKETMSSAFRIEGMQAIGYPEYKDGRVVGYRAYYLIIAVRPDVGTRTIDLDKSLLSFAARDHAVPAAKYVPITDVLMENNMEITAAEGNLFPTGTWNNIYNNVVAKGSACAAEFYNIMKNLGTSNQIIAIPFIAPMKSHEANAEIGSIIARRDESRYTVVWKNCNDNEDIGTLADGQIAYIIYPLPVGLRSGDWFRVSVQPPTGRDTRLTDLRIPAGLDQGIVDVI